MKRVVAEDNAGQQLLADPRPCINTASLASQPSPQARPANRKGCLSSGFRSMPPQAPIAV
jgi:hypothetical protein